MKILIIDFFNLIKRYSYQLDIVSLEQGEIVDKLTVFILNKITDCIYQTQADLIFVCSDDGQNKRAKGIISEYKENRKKAKTLTEEEKEKDFFNYLKKLVKILPVGFIEVKNTEADMIIYCLVNYFKKYQDIDITIASSDSDFVQLLDKNVSILDWTKGEITEENWVQKIEKIDDLYFNPKHYALAKSITGDTSDNIKGVKNYGWKKVFRIFCYLYLNYSVQVNIENIFIMIDLLKKIDSNEYDKKEKKFLFKAIEILEANKDTIHKNMSIIDLNMLETPYIFNIMQQIDDILTKKKTFSRQEILNMLKLERFGDRSDFEYQEVVKKNSKSLMIFDYIFKKYLKSVAILKLKNKGNKI